MGKKLEGADKEEWQQLPQDSCDVNNTASRGAMETEAGKVMWGRSVDLMDAQYVSIVTLL